MPSYLDLHFDLMSARLLQHVHPPKRGTRCISGHWAGAFLFSPVLHPWRHMTNACRCNFAPLSIELPARFRFTRNLTFFAKFIASTPKPRSPVFRKFTERIRWRAKRERALFSLPRAEEIVGRAASQIQTERNVCRFCQHLAQSCHTHCHL